jgi:hypothetical protein
LVLLGSRGEMESSSLRLRGTGGWTLLVGPVRGSRQRRLRSSCGWRSHCLCELVAHWRPWSRCSCGKNPSVGGRPSWTWRAPFSRWPSVQRDAEIRSKGDAWQLTGSMCADELWQRVLSSSELRAIDRGLFRFGSLCSVMAWPPSMHRVRVALWIVWFGWLLFLVSLILPSLTTSGRDTPISASH